MLQSNEAHTHYKHRNCNFCHKLNINNDDRSIAEVLAATKQNTFLQRLQYSSPRYTQLSRPNTSYLVN